MSTLFPNHLKPFADAFEEAVRAGRISVMQAMLFVELVEQTVLEQRERVHRRAGLDARGHKPRTPTLSVVPTE
jgi:hypothetical protein